MIEMPTYVLVRVPTKKALLMAIAKAGSQKKLGDCFGVSQQAIFKWLHNGKVPMQYWGAVLKFIR